MEELCGSGGGWTRLAYLDMTDTVLLGLDCTSQEELEFVVEQHQVEAVVHQFSSHPMVSVTLKCVVE